MPAGDREIRFDDMESVVEHVLPVWLRRIWRVELPGDEMMVALENAFRGLYENAYGLLEDLPRMAEWKDYESYAIMKSYFVAGIVVHWRTIIGLGGLAPAFRDSHIMFCPHCGGTL